MPRGRVATPGSVPGVTNGYPRNVPDAGSPLGSPLGLLVSTMPEKPESGAGLLNSGHTRLTAAAVLVRPTVAELGVTPDPCLVPAKHVLMPR